MGTIKQPNPCLILLICIHSTIMKCKEARNSSVKPMLLMRIRNLEEKYLQESQERKYICCKDKISDLQIQQYLYTIILLAAVTERRLKQNQIVKGSSSTSFRTKNIHTIIFLCHQMPVSFGIWRHSQSHC